MFSRREVRASGRDGRKRRSSSGVVTARDERRAGPLPTAHGRDRWLLSSAYVNGVSRSMVSRVGKRLDAQVEALIGYAVAVEEHPNLPSQGLDSVACGGTLCGGSARSTRWLNWRLKDTQCPTSRAMPIRKLFVDRQIKPLHLGGT